MKLKELKAVCSRDADVTITAIAYSRLGEKDEYYSFRTTYSHEPFSHVDDEYLLNLEVRFITADSNGELWIDVKEYI